MKNIHTSILSAILVGASMLITSQSNAQLFPTASVLLSNHDITNYAISSADDYTQVESSIATLSAKLHDAYVNHPNLQYTPSYNNDEVIGFIVTGVNNSEEANDISLTLMELELLGGVANSADDKYLPSIDEATSRVSKREASR